jgi:hypothetical protein
MSVKGLQRLARAEPAVKAIDPVTGKEVVLHGKGKGHGPLWDDFSELRARELGTTANQFDEDVDWDRVHDMFAEPGGKLIGSRADIARAARKEAENTPYKATVDEIFKGRDWASFEQLKRLKGIVGGGAAVALLPSFAQRAEANIFSESREPTIGPQDSDFIDRLRGQLASGIETLSEDPTTGGGFLSSLLGSGQVGAGLLAEVANAIFPRDTSSSSTVHHPLIARLTGGRGINPVEGALEAIFAAVPPARLGGKAAKKTAKESFKDFTKRTRGEELVSPTGGVITEDLPASGTVALQPAARDVKTGQIVAGGGGHFDIMGWLYDKGKSDDPFTYSMENLEDGFYWAEKNKFLTRTEAESLHKRLKKQGVKGVYFDNQPIRAFDPADHD